MRPIRHWPSSPDSHGRDGPGSTATPVQAPTGVVTAATRVVHPPCDKTRPVPVRSAQWEGPEHSSPGEDATLRVRTKTLRSRGLDRDYPIPFRRK